MKPARAYEAEIINELESFWRLNLLNTRFDVLGFCVGFYGSVNESILEAVVMLYCDGFIKA